jgi:hypothetical protein
VFTENINLDRIVWRWVRGFHAALYREFLPSKRGGFVHTPFSPGRKDGENITFERIHPEQFLVPAEIKKNRIARNIDVIEFCNQKCRYESVFVRLDNGAPVCFWALRLYEWEKLADSRWPGTHGCIGSYYPPAGIPSTAAKGTNLDFPFPNKDPLNPFEE